jgi:hypothetical protein
MKCLSCKFFNIENSQQKMGSCRRHPPKVFFAPVDGQVRFMATFPQVRGEADWCGEYVTGLESASVKPVVEYDKH